MPRTKTVGALALSAALMVPALSQAAPSTEKIERKVERVVERRIFDNVYARCIKTRPSVWSCTIVSVTRGTDVGRLRAQLVGIRLYVGPIR